MPALSLIIMLVRVMSSLVAKFVCRVVSALGSCFMLTATWVEFGNVSSRTYTAPILDNGITQRYSTQAKLAMTNMSGMHTCTVVECLAFQC